MKQIIKAVLLAFASVYLMLGTTYTYAVETPTGYIDESAYAAPHHRVINIYSNFVPYVLFSILAIGMLYVTYRYWADNRPDHHDMNNHRLGH